MWRLAGLIVLICWLAGCDAGSPWPALSGQWGGTGLHIDAAARSATVQYYCSYGLTSALRVGPGGIFTASGRYYPLQLPTDSSPITLPLWLEAVPSVDTLIVTSYIGFHDPAHAVTYRVRRDAPTDVYNAGCLH